MNNIRPIQKYEFRAEAPLRGVLVFTVERSMGVINCYASGGWSQSQINGFYQAYRREIAIIQAERRPVRTRLDFTDNGADPELLQLGLVERLCLLANPRDRIALLLHRDKSTMDLSDELPAARCAAFGSYGAANRWLMAA